MPVLGSGEAGEFAGMYATYQQLQAQIFVEAMDGLFIVTAVITMVGIGLAPAAAFRPGSEGQGPRRARRGLTTGSDAPDRGITGALPRLFAVSTPRHLQRRRVVPCGTHARFCGRARSTSRCSWCCSSANRATAVEAVQWIAGALLAALAALVVHRSGLLRRRPRVYLSHRRSDSAAETGRVVAALRRRYGRRAVVVGPPAGAVGVVAARGGRPGRVPVRRRLHRDRHRLDHEHEQQRQATPDACA